MTTGESLILYGLIGSGLAQIYSAFKQKRAEIAAKGIAEKLEASKLVTDKHRESIASTLVTIQRSVNGNLLKHQKTIWKMALRIANLTKLPEDYEIAHSAEVEYMIHKKQVETEKEAKAS